MGHSLRHRSRHPLLVALVVFLLAAVASASLIWRLEHGDLQGLRQRTSLHVANYANALQRSIEGTLSVTYALAALVRQGNGGVRDFDAVASAMLPLYPGASSLQLAPRGIVQSIAPLAGNERAIGHDLLKDPTRTKAAFLARNTGKLTLDGPFNLVQGGLGAVGRLPVYLSNDGEHPSFWGFTSVLIRFPEALKAAGLSELSEQGLVWELWRIHPDSGQKQTIAASLSAAMVEPVVQPVQVPNAIWNLSVAPEAGWFNPSRLSIRAVLGLLFSLLLGYLAKLLVELRAYKRGLEALLAQRTAEVLSREADLNRAQSIARVGSWAFDLARNEFRGSAELARIFGASAPVGYDLFLQRVHVEDRETVDRTWQMALKGAPYDIEYRIMGGAEIRWVHSHAELTFETDGTLRQALGTVQDITERKRTEEALRATEEQFRGLVEQSITGIYIIQDGKLAYVNPHLAKIFGYDSAEKLIGRDLMLTVAEKDRDNVKENLRSWLDGEVRSISYDFTAIRKDGTMTEIGAHGAGATHRGRPAIIGLMQDISEKKRAEAQIQGYVAQLETAFMSTVEVATTLSELRDPYTAGHERRVGEIAVAIGKELGLDARRQEGLRVAGYLHDIGKITIPAEILSKPGKLSPIEFQLIQGHAQASYDVLKDVEFPWRVAEVVLQHHERMDGSGYPQGLRGEAILLDARIIAVADVIEAMSLHRPYRAGLGIEVALSEIERGRGSVYDAEVANACLRLFRERRYQVPA